MAVFEYKALDTKGKETSGIIETESRVSAAQSLKRMQLYPIAIQETTGKTIEKKRREYSIGDFFERISKADVSVFTTQFAALIEAGMPVVTSLDICIQQTEKKSMKRMLSVIKDEVNKGTSLAESFRLFPRHFSQLYVNMVMAGEESGSLEVVVMRLADFLQSQLEMRSKIMATLAYPILMLIIGMTVVLFLLIYVIPTVTTIFADMNQALPLPTTILLGTSAFFKKSWLYLLIGFVTVVFVYNWYKRTPRGEALFDRLKMTIPMIGSQYMKIIMARFTRTLGTLLANGVPIVASFEIVKNIMGNSLIAREIEKARDEIKEGKEISDPLSKSGFFPPVVINMIGVGEKSGQLEEMLNRASRIMESELESSLKKMISLLEPVMILFMGGIVLFIVVAILLPIFEMNQLIK